MLYEALTGGLPYPPEEYEDAVREPPSLEPLPGELRDIVGAMLTLKPQDRPTAEQVRDALASILARMEKS